ncbi:class A beta-lactamase-related serine hydrolase [Mycobacterium sp. 852002-51057_SCH5723018]|uniref:class A beta-lactamase-related serine hydrolase n=1 Tax=Mycobacterium sp. 852002-51057_SCH5723018 TaxID=1834094 RepID=UPI001E2DC17C|nr:class A beta-lactamase-related serine hydrolase [Mycobacterium sp. 852002-51057_SCH5723018]
MTPQRYPISGSSRKLWLISVVALLAAAALTAGVIIGERLDSRKPPTAALAADLARLQTRLRAVVGVAVSAVGSEQQPIVLGDWESGPAWSTIKVPLVIAALRERNPPEVTGAMTAAITESDNAAAESIWAGLGDPVTAARKVEAVLRGTGDPTTVQSQKLRPEFTAFGQTDWSLIHQLRFTSVAYCDSANAPIFGLMGRVEPDQRWGIGTVPDALFKGGWGPSPTGSYLVRQLGVLAAPNGRIAVALAAQPASGTFEDGTAALTEMATWLAAHVTELPAGNCGH